MSKIILVIAVLCSIVACNDGAPPKQQVEEIFKSYLQENLPTNWAGSLLGGKLKRLDLLQVQEIGKSMKKANGGKMPELYAAIYQDCWPVRVHAKGVSMANLIIKSEEHPFNQIGIFMLCSTYDNRWGIEGDSFQNNPVEEPTTEKPSNTENLPNSEANITIINNNCWPQDFYINNQRLATIPANTSQVVHVRPGTYTTKACTANTSNCGTPGSTTWVEGAATYTISPHPSCPKYESPNDQSKVHEPMEKPINTQDAINASFDCDKARTAPEIAICSSSELRQMDKELASLYRSRLKDYKRDPNIDLKLRDTQKSWLTERNLCNSDIACLRTRYQDRISWLREFEAYD